MQSRNVGAEPVSTDAPKPKKRRLIIRNVGFGFTVFLAVSSLLSAVVDEEARFQSAFVGILAFVALIPMSRRRRKAIAKERIAQEKLRAEAAAKIEQERIAEEKAEDEVIAVIEKHAATLQRKRRQLVRVDDYGNTFADAWEREVEYFLNHVISPVSGDFLLDVTLVDLAREVIELVSQEPMEYGDSPDVDSMDPIEYEHYCAELLRNTGWEARVTTVSGDQGVDVIATRDGKTLVVQAKRYSGSVGNAAVQEALAGKQFVGADLAAVVSPAPFTKSAVELANTTGVLLLHHDGLRTL